MEITVFEGGRSLWPKLSGRRGHPPPTILSVRKLDASTIDRRDVRIRIGLLTGHNTLNRHLALLKKQTDALCPLCEDEQETSLHFLGDVVPQWYDEYNTSNDHF